MTIESLDDTPVKACDASDLSPAPGGRVADATGRFLIHGLWDMPVQVLGSSGQESPCHDFRQASKRRSKCRIPISELRA